MLILAESCRNNDRLKLYRMNIVVFVKEIIISYADTIIIQYLTKIRNYYKTLCHLNPRYLNCNLKV